MFWIGLLAGWFVGSLGAFFVLALCLAAAKN
jgi:hypothetical protein